MENIREILKKTAKELFDITVEPTILVPEEKFGDYSTNLALVLAKQLNQNPREIADRILDFIAERPEINFDCVIAGAGFINFSLHDSTLLDFVEHSLTDDKFGQNELYKNQVIVAEFSDPNPFKVLHVGHLYTSIIGDVISNIVANAGGKVHRVSFGGDVGLHVAKTMWAILKKQAEIDRVEPTKQADWLAERYIEGNKAYSDDDKVKSEITEINKQIYDLHDKDDHTSDFAKIYWKTRQWSYDYFDDFYDSVNVQFEKYYPESATAKKGKDIVLKELKNGIYEESNGAVIFDGEKYGLHTRVFINSEGLPTYEAKDVGLIFQKEEDYHFDKSIVITGNEQAEYMKVVLKSIEQYRPDLAEKTLHFTHGLVKLEGGVKMSSRDGNVIKAVDVIDITKGELQKAQSAAPQELVLGAIRYAFLKHSIGSDIVYSPETSVNLNGNSGPYLQYAGARAKSILRKIDLRDNYSLDNWELDEFERALAVKLFRFNEMIEQATVNLAPHQICSYIYELAGTFNRFYENSKVANDPREDLRVSLVQLYVNTLDKGLDILGIPTMERI